MNMVSSTVKMGNDSWMLKLVNVLNIILEKVHYVFVVELLWDVEFYVLKYLKA